MVKMKYLLIIFIFVFVFIYGDFNVIYENDYEISIHYSVDSLTSNKGIVLPSGADYNIDISPDYINVSDIVSSPFYFGDLYILPIKIYNSDYTITIHYNQPYLTGRKMQITKKEKKFFGDFLLNSDKINNYIKPRKAINKKLSYSGTPIAKIKLDSTGIYRVYYSEIQAITETNLSSISPQSIQLFNNDREIPLYFYGISDGVFNSGDYFEFYGQRKDGDSTYFDRYNLQNVYILTVNGNSGARYVIYDSESIDDSLIIDTINTILQTIHIEKDSIFIRFYPDSSVDTSDYWFYYSVNETDSAYDKSLNIDFPFIDTTYKYFNLKAKFHGKTRYVTIYPDHPVEFYMNDSLYDEFAWNDLLPYEYTNDSIFIDTLNNVTLFFKPLNIIKGAKDITNDILLNWVEYEYCKHLTTEDDFINFSLPDTLPYGYYKIKISGFSSGNIEIYRKDLKKIENYEIEYDSLNNTYTVIFKDNIQLNNNIYSVFANNSVLTADVVNYNYENISDCTNQGDYLIIVPQALKTYAEDFADLFTDNHYVFVAGTEEIYNEFSYGFISPYAINEFIKTAYNNWAIPPTHVLLLGDGTKDMNNHFGNFEYQIPVVFAYHFINFGYTVSDNFYGRIVGDDHVEDISISRFPIKNGNDILNFKNKISHYMNKNNRGIYNLRGIFAFDTIGYSSSDDFTRTLISSLPEQLYADTFMYKETTDETFLQEFQQGAFIAHFVAHGSTVSIGDDIFFRIFDVFRMTNIDRLPFVTVFSCNTVEFDQLYEDSLTIGEAFVVNPVGGGIAFYGAVATSSENENHQLSTNIFKQFIDNGIKNIGEIVQYAEFAFYLQSPANQREIEDYTLMGANFVDLPIPEVTNQKVDYLSEYVYPGDTLIVRINDSIIDNGIIESVLLNADRMEIAHSAGEIVSGYGENKIPIPSTIQLGNMSLITYVRDNDTSFVYISNPSVGQIGFSYLGLSPDMPDTNDTYRIITIIKEQGALNSIYAYKKYSSESSFTEFDMTRDTVDTTLFYTEEFAPLTPRDSDFNLEYRISISDTEGNVYNSVIKKYFVPQLADLMFEDTTVLRIKSYENKPYLYCSLVNNSFRKVNIQNAFYYSDTLLDSIIGIDTLYNFFNTDTTGIIVNDDVFQRKVIVKANYNNLISESNNYNNTISFYPIEYKIMYIPDTLDFENYYDFNIDIISHTSDSAFIALSRYLSKDSINDIIPYYISGDEYYIYEILNGDSLSIGIEAMLSDITGEEHDYKIFKYNNKYNQYELIEDTLQTAEKITLNSGINKFIIADFTDSIAPRININIENNEFIDNIILSNRIKIGCTIEDNSGIKIDEITILINEDTLADSNYSVIESGETYSVPIKIEKELVDGFYQITVIARDVFNNESSQILDFQVLQSFYIQHTANFPNPVRDDYTVIAAQITEAAKNIKYYLFNSSGVLINTINLGSQDKGIVTYNLDVSNLSNGTYFYYFEAIDYEDKYYKSEINKMSILR